MTRPIGSLVKSWWSSRDFTRAGFCDDPIDVDCAGVAGTSAASAASFDCDKASKLDEKTICENRSLNDADVRMSTMFDLAINMVAMGERDGLMATQLKWLDTRAKCEGDVSCLKAVYDQRISDLQKVFADFDARVAQ